MASRRATARRRESLVNYLDEFLSSGETAPGDALPSLRTMAERFALSQPTVLREINQYLASGVLRSVPGVGVFVAQRRPDLGKRFVFVRDSTTASITAPLDQIRAGFEARVTELGGSTAAMTSDQLDDPAQSGLLDDASGVFLWRLASHQKDPRRSRGREMPFVFDGYHPSGWQTTSPADTVRYDDVDGGRQATLHLFRAGHRDIAYFGLHRHSNSPLVNKGWSYLRETGWREAMHDIGGSTDRRSFVLPPHAPKFTDETDTARFLALRMLDARSEFTAVVCAGSRAVRGLIEVWTESGVPYGEWPAVVGFEHVPGASFPELTTSICPAWPRVGEEAAQVLWNRTTGRLSGSPVERLVPMILSSRLTSHRGWAGERGISAILQAIA